MGTASLNGLAEQVIASASATGLRASIVRVGQLSGGLNGFWNAKEWLPSLIQASNVLKKISEDERLVTWIPLDMASRAITDLLHTSTSLSTSVDVPDVLHLVHPNPVSWTNFARSPNASTLDLNAFVLLDFFKIIPTQIDRRDTEAFGMPLLAMEKAPRQCQSLKESATRALGEEDIQLWVNYWQKAGMFA
ncbi:hypothetical protein PQX77_011688 [Marasmius sp. AFHP31]|nr:hypothetical protein PQX77_011688 [Marasmius sp. AFHP31]